MSFLEELKRRSVLRVGAAYVVSSWLVIQVAETVLPFYGVADSVIRWIITLLAIGLVPTLVLAWVFEWTPEGLRRDSETPEDHAASKEGARKLDRAIMIVLALALGYFAVDKFVLDPARDRALVEETTQQARSDALTESYGDRSIAVLPFADMSANQDQEYLSDGIAEELLNLLAKVPELRVISRSSAFSFKGKDIDIPEIARRLNTVYVLEGSVRQAGDQVRITAQLIDGRSDTHLWSETYDRKLENIFQIQDDISGAVVEQLKLTLLGEAPRTRVMNQAAYQHLLQARYFWNRRAEGDVERAHDHFEAALEISPDSAEAWAGLAWAKSVLANANIIDREEGRRLAEAAARKAVELDPTLSDAHVRLGQAQMRAGQYRHGVESFRRALELNPDDPLALGVNALVQWHTGDLDGSIRMLEKIEQIDPLSTIWPANRAAVLIRAGRFDEAMAAAERAFTISGNQAEYDALRAIIYELTGRYEESWELTRNAPDLPDPMVGKAILLHFLGRQAEAEAVRRKLEEMNPPFIWFHMAKIYARWGEFDRAFAELTPDNVANFHYWHLQYDPHLKDLQDDPRWKAVLDSADDPLSESEADSG
ncbi:MAG: tetratricopeptide repeat protein [Xanthomonadales bacterium]|nr:tetratricopeptide repeat protein [Xanthomonadales bacterium]